MAGKSLLKYVAAGDKVEIRKTGKEKGERHKTKTTVYYSQVYHVISEERIAITMPTQKGKLVLLPVGAEYDLIFFSSGSLYQCKAKVASRGKKGNIFLLGMELVSDLRMEQRREFYRSSCIVEMGARALSGEEVEKLEREGILENMMPEGAVLNPATMVDISGGGLRFMSEQAYEKESIVLCKYQLDTEKGVKEYELLTKVLHVQKAERNPGVYEHRVQYIDIEDRKREEIIKYIFDAQRKKSKNSYMEKHPMQ